MIFQFVWFWEAASHFLNLLFGYTQQHSATSNPADWGLHLLLSGNWEKEGGRAKAAVVCETSRVPSRVLQGTKQHYCFAILIAENHKAKTHSVNTATEWDIKNKNKNEEFYYSDSTSIREFKVFNAPEISGTRKGFGEKIELHTVFSNGAAGYVHFSLKYTLKFLCWCCSIAIIKGGKKCKHPKSRKINMFFANVKK